MGEKVAAALLKSRNKGNKRKENEQRMLRNYWKKLRRHKPRRKKDYKRKQKKEREEKLRKQLKN